MSERQSLAHWRDSLMTALKARGTTQACDALKRAISLFPQYGWLKWHLLEAEEIARRRSWIPLVPKNLISLAANAERRLVQNGDQLLDLLLGSLSRLETQLQGVTPEAPFLWNEVKDSVFRPKEEPRLSDYIKRHFERDIQARAIVVNREVEIRQRMGQTPGEETDIQVDATYQLPGGDHDRITAIVEVKGCWNRGVLTAMEAQLKNRYLKDNQSPYGLYVVGWFVCPQWDSTDYRKNDTPKVSLDELRRRLQVQAAALSSGDCYLEAFVLNAALR